MLRFSSYCFCGAVVFSFNFDSFDYFLSHFVDIEVSGIDI